MDYTVYQRKSDNKWVGSFYYYSENGKRKKVVAYGKTSREATKKIREKTVLFIPIAIEMIKVKKIERMKCWLKVIPNAPIPMSEKPMKQSLRPPSLSARLPVHARINEEDIENAAVNTPQLMSPMP